MAWKRDSAYWKARIEKEKPAIFAKLESGELASVRAAAIEAGFIKERTKLMDLRRAWHNANKDERATFLKEVTS